MLPPASGKPRLLLVELWGVGDLTISTTLLRAALAAGWEVTVLAKAYARALLEPSFPEVHFLVLEAPWTAFRGKYQLWKWPHGELARVVALLRRQRFDAAVSVRPDPRDHLLMWLSGARCRPGFPRRGSGIFLTQALVPAHPKQHRVEDWRALRAALGIPPTGDDSPCLDPPRYASAKVDGLLRGITEPILCLHAGARIAVRRWPAEYYAHVIRRLRERFRFHLLLIPETDVYGRELAPLADSIAPPLTLGEVVALFGRIDLLLCNDSGPGHIAASCGRPVISIFGPGDPDWFRPWGEGHRVIRDICALRPCFDYCIFPEPYCLTRLLPEPAGEEIEAHLGKLLEDGRLPAAFRK